MHNKYMGKWENTQGRGSIMQLDTSVALNGDGEQIKQGECITITDNTQPTKMIE